MTKEQYVEIYQEILDIDGMINEHLDNDEYDSADELEKESSQLIEEFKEKTGIDFSNPIAEMLYLSANDKSFQKLLEQVS